MDMGKIGGNMDHALILDALKRANKLGGKGIQIVDYILPESAISDYKITLITAIVKPRTAAEGNWYDE